MREIKFRAWDKKSKSFLQLTPYNWLEGDDTKGNKTLFFDNQFKVTDINCDRQTGKSVFLTFDGGIVNILPNTHECTRSINISDEYELMQYTGLKDKNGTEIYEGDICKDSVEYTTAPIRRHPGYFSFMGCILGSDMLDQENMELEVIGNIYENPELLK